MTDLSQIQTAIDGVKSLVEQSRGVAESAALEVKKFGDSDALTKAQLDAMKQDFAAQTQDIIEMKRLLSLQTERKDATSGLTAEQKSAKTALFKVFQKKDLSDLEQKALSTLTNPDGGYLMPVDMTGRVIEKLRDISPMRRYANVEQTSVSTKHGLVNNGRNAFSWGFQGVTPTDTATKQWGKYSIPVRKIFAYFNATDEMLEDAGLNVEQLMLQDTLQAFAEGESLGFMLGSGDPLQPRGLMTVATATTGDNVRAWGTVQKFKTGANGAFLAAPNGGDVLVRAGMSLRSKYRSGAIWGMNRFTLAEVMLLKNSEGDYIWNGAWNLTAAPFGTICGIPIAADFDHAADIANDSLSIFVGDLSQAYTIVDHTSGVSITRDNITDPSRVKWYAAKRVGGDLVDSEAVRFIEFKA